MSGQHSAAHERTYPYIVHCLADSYHQHLLGYIYLRVWVCVGIRESVRWIWVFKIGPGKMLSSRVESSIANKADQTGCYWR